MGGANFKLPCGQAPVDRVILKWSPGDVKLRLFEAGIMRFTNPSVGHSGLIPVSRRPRRHQVRPDIWTGFDGNTVHFKDGRHAIYDLILGGDWVQLHYVYPDTGF